MTTSSIQADLDAARRAATVLNTTPAEKIDALLLDLSSAIIANTDALMAANAADLDRMDPADPKYDRLRLTPERIRSIAADTAAVAALPSPVGVTIRQWERPGGMIIRKVSVPFGVIGAVYEARPNVTFDIFSLCIKAASATLLKGGSDAADTNRCAISVIHSVLDRHGLPRACATLLPTDHQATLEMLRAVGKVDLVIPRGSRRLIDFVRDNARVPVIETGAGVCHTYIHADASLDYARDIVNNAKTRRVSVCNALDCLIVHRDRLGDLPYLCGKLSGSNVVIYADEPAFAALSGHYPTALLQPATADSFGTEFLDYKMAIRTVSSLDEALQHIARYSSKHSESIVSESTEAIRRFQQMVDAACVYANVSTAFTDGAQFGFGAEIGISTQKLHARGPMALPELTTYKYIIEGDGQIRK